MEEREEPRTGLGCVYIEGRERERREEGDEVVNALLVG